MHYYKRQNISLYLLFFIIGLSACNTPKTDVSIFPEAPEEKLDQYCSYLKNTQNASNNAYMPFFYKRFNKLVHENKIDSAAQILTITGDCLRKIYILDSSFIKTNLHFLGKFGKKLSSKYYSNLYSNVGLYYSDIGKFDMGTYYLNKSMVPANDKSTYQNNAYSAYSLIFCHLNNGRLAQSLSNGFKALKMYENLKDTAYLGATYSGIACIYRFQDDYTEALNYENQGFELIKKTSDSDKILVVSLNKISLYNDMNNPNLGVFIDSTRRFAQAWSKKTDLQLFGIESWYAFKLVFENKLEEAKVILDKLKPLVNSVDEVSRDYYFNAFSEYEIKMGQGSKIIDYYHKKIPELKENEDYLRLSLYNHILHDDAFLKKDYKNALYYQRQFQIATDSLNNKVLRIKVKEFDKKYKTAQKEQQIHLQEAEISKKNSLIGLLVSSIIGLFLLITTYYLWHKQKNLTQEKNNSMNFTKQLLENTETERKRIASDLHDSISHELLNLKSGLSQDIAIVSNKIDGIINDIRGISRNLHPVMFDKIGLEPNIEALIERIQYQNDFMVNLDIDYSGSLTSSDELQIYRIIQEALTNVIKYANAYAAKITINDGNDKVFIEIRDNGKGFDVKNTINSGKAFGLHNIIERSRVIGGQANIQSSQEGTIITISIAKK